MTYPSLKKSDEGIVLGCGCFSVLAALAINLVLLGLAVWVIVLVLQWTGVL